MNIYTVWVAKPPEPSYDCVTGLVVSARDELQAVDVCKAYDPKGTGAENAPEWWDGAEVTKIGTTRTRKPQVFMAHVLWA